MKQKELNPKDFVLPSYIPHSEPGIRGMTVPKNTGWHNIKTLKPVAREVAADDSKFNAYKEK